MNFYNQDCIRDVNYYLPFLNVDCLKVDFVNDSSTSFTFRPDGSCRYLDSAYYWIDTVPSYCGGIFIHGVENPKYLDEFLVCAFRAAELGGYTSITCILPSYNISSATALRKRGFIKVEGYSHNNIRSENDIDMWQYIMPWKDCDVDAITLDDWVRQVGGDSYDCVEGCYSKTIILQEIL